MILNWPTVRDNFKRRKLLPIRNCEHLEIVNVTKDKVQGKRTNWGINYLKQTGI